MASSALEVLQRAAKLTYDDHIGRLLSISQADLEAIRPNKRLALQDILEKYNSEVGREIVRFGEQLQADVSGVLERLDGSSEFPATEAVLDVIGEFVAPDLYQKRFELFTQAIERRMDGYGVRFNLAEHRIDIPKSLAKVGATNLCRKIRQRIANSVDTIGLAKPSVPKRSTLVETGIYSKINSAYAKHPVAFWGVGLLISGMLGTLFL
jgi:hypothetical protein